MTSNVNKSQKNTIMNNPLNVQKLKNSSKVTVTKLRNSSWEVNNEGKESDRWATSTMNVQASTQPTTTSMALKPKNPEDITSVPKNRHDFIVSSNFKQKNAGIRYHKHNNPQNDLNIWRSSMVRAKPLPYKITELSKNGNCCILNT